jgi:hypothetical protein
VKLSSPRHLNKHNTITPARQQLVDQLLTSRGDGVMFIQMTWGAQLHLCGCDQQAE